MAKPLGRGRRQKQGSLAGTLANKARESTHSENKTKHPEIARQWAVSSLRLDRVGKHRLVLRCVLWPITHLHRMKGFDAGNLFLHFLGLIKLGRN